MASKYRFVTATEDKQDKQIQNVSPTGAIWDCSSMLAASSEFIAVPWHTPGAVGIFKAGQPFVTKPGFPFLFGHTGAVIDLAFSPFDPRLLATASEDATVKIWNIPEEGVTAKTDAAAATLTAHSKKVGMLQFHPSANNILATASTDNTVRIWDLNSTGSAAFTLSPTEDQLFSINFNLDGSLMCATSKDKKVSVFDTRTGAIVSSAAAHEGIKNQRAVWAKRRNHIITCGFGKGASCREIKVWDPRNLSAAAFTLEVDKQSAVLMPFIDEDTGLYFLGGKGEGGLRYYELRDDGAAPIVAANAYGSNDLAKGLCMAPKTTLNVAGNELARFYKLTTKSVVGVHLNLPRRGTEFQPDFFPPTFASVPAMSAAEFAAGKNAEPLLQDMKAVYEGKAEPVVVGSPVKAAAPAPAPVEPSAPTPVPEKVPTPKEASKPATPVAEKPSAPEAEKPATPEAEKPATPEAEKPATPEAEKPATPEAEKPATPEAEKPATPEAEKPATPEAEPAVEAAPAPEEAPKAEEAAPAVAEEATSEAAAASVEAEWDGVGKPTSEQLEAQTARVAKLTEELAAQKAVLAKMQAAVKPAPQKKVLESSSSDDEAEVKAAKPAPKGMPKPRKYSDSDSD